MAIRSLSLTLTLGTLTEARPARGSTGPATAGVRVAAVTVRGLSRLRRQALPRLSVTYSALGITLALAAVAGVALRVWRIGTPAGIPNSDEAVVGLMARHAVHGDVTVFFWGQHYGGSQEVILTAPLFLVAGSSWVALRIVPILLTAVAALLIWRVGRRTIGERPALVAAGMFWVWPPFNIHQLTHQTGFYASDVVYCGLLLLLALRIVERPDRVRVGLFGLVFGLAFWQTAQIAPIAAPLIAWTIWKQPRCLRHLWAAVVLAVVGALPWIVWNAAHGWESLVVHHGLSSYEHSLRLFVSPLLPMTLGLRAPFSMQPIVPMLLMDLLYASLIALFLYGAYRARRRNTSLLYLLVAAYPFFFAIDRKTSFLTNEPRYVIILTPVIALLVAQLARRESLAVALLVLASLTSIVDLHRADTYGRETIQPAPSAPRDFSPLISTLDRVGVDRVYAEYWIAYRLDFDSRERIIAVENRFRGVSFASGQAIPSPDSNIRYRPYEREVQSARHGFVFFRKTIGAISIVPQLERHGYRRYDVGTMVVLAPPPG